MDAGEEATEALTNFLWELGAVGVVEEATGGAPASLRAFFPATTDGNTLTARVDTYLDGLRTLGLTVVMTMPRRDGVAVAALEGGGLLVELIEHATAKPGGAEPHLTHGFTKAGIIVDDFDRTVAALKTRGIPIVMGPFPPRPTMRANLGIRDHAGNLIQIFGGYAAR